MNSKRESHYDGCKRKMKSEQNKIIISKNVIYKITFERLLKRLGLKDKKLVSLWVSNLDRCLEITVEGEKNERL